MALLEGSIFSQELNLSTSLVVSLPADTLETPKNGFPTVYLLHGYSDDHTGWLRRTNVDRYAREHGVAVVMPEAQHSFYCDMKYGLKYFSYVADELPRLCQKLFHLSPRRQDTMVAGLSMGGYGALKCALSRPQTFCAAASLSGAVDLHTTLDSHRDRDLDEFRAIVGPELTVPSEDDLRLLAVSAAKLPVPQRPRLFLCCGTEDSLLEDNRRFDAFLTEKGLAHGYQEGPGNHEWSFWDHWLPTVLDFLLKGRPAD